MKKTIGILAHVDAGKTTFAEQILYHTKSIRSRGRVDHKNAFLDNHEIERDRGITIFTDQAVFTYRESTCYLIDTPGHADFSSEMERALQIMDYAVVIISAVEGVQGHTETVWQLLRNLNIPTFFFINKIDRVGANIENVIAEIKVKLTGEILFTAGLVPQAVKNTGCLSISELKNTSPGLMEFVAERDENLLELYLQGRVEKVDWLLELKQLIKQGRVFPCMAGSALQDVGITEFVEVLDLLSYSDYEEKSSEKFSGRVYKIRHDEQGNRVTYLKALSGKLSVKDALEYGRQDEVTGSGRPSEKINQIRIYNGTRFSTREFVSAGEIFAVTGLSKACAGDGAGTLEERAVYRMIPALKSRLVFDKSLNNKEVLNKMKLLEAEDPALNVSWNEALQELHFSIMGVIQLEVLKQVIEQRFSYKVDFGPCQVLYRETVSRLATGYGHFEPLRHYAEVHLRLEPAPRNSGISFESACHIDDLLPSYQNLIRSHLFEKEHNGVLTGSSVTDVKITLLTGRAHLKHTSGGDFREATLRALRQGLEKAGCILLEPFYRFRIEVDTDSMGRVLSDIQKMHGDFEPPETRENKVTIRGRGPVATFMNYSMELVSFTKGKGSINLFFDGYDICHNESEVIENSGYNKNADPEYTSNSIFCAKGAGFTVEAGKVEEYMHCL